MNIDELRSKDTGEIIDALAALSVDQAKALLAAEEAAEAPRAALVEAIKLRLLEDEAGVDFEAILDGSIKDVVAVLPSLKAEEIAELRRREEAGKTRVGVIRAIEAEQAARAAEGASPAAARAEPAAPAKAKPWQAEDYNGPLTGDQASWRNANLKPRFAVVTK